MADTTNFKGYWGFVSTTPTLHVVERFTRIDADSLHYEFTVNDPGMWTDTWSGDYIWPATTKAEERVYEYACHEGNYAVGNILRGAEFVHPDSDCLIANRNIALSEQIFNVSNAEVEAVVQPNSVLDDGGWEAMSFIDVFQLSKLPECHLICQHPRELSAIYFKGGWLVTEIGR